MRDFVQASFQILPVWSTFVVVHVYCSKRLVMVQTTWLMAQETLPSCDETSVKSQYISIWERTASKGYTDLKRLCYSSGEREREIKALLECRKVMLNYTIHELNRTVFWFKKKGKTLQFYRWLNSKQSLQKQGLIMCLCNVGATGQVLEDSAVISVEAQACTIRHILIWMHPVQNNRSWYAAFC